MRHTLPILIALSSACAPDGAPAPLQASPDDDAPPVPTAEGGQFTEEDLPECEILSSTPLQPGEPGPHGWTADGVLLAFGASHLRTLTWALDGRSTPLEISLSDVRDPRWLEREETGTQTDIGILGSSSTSFEPLCPDVLAVDATLSLRSDDGALDEILELEILAGPSPTLSLELDLDAPSGSLDPADHVVGTWDRIDRTWALLLADQAVLTGVLQIAVSNEVPITEIDQEAQGEIFEIASIE